MSLSFRNLFTPEDGEWNAFSAPGGTPGGQGAERGGGDFGHHGADGREKGASQSFLASEVLSFIPPAISAPSGIPMGKEIRVPLPPDGTRDVRLSTIYRLCPELFAAEITPLNDSVLTLPPRLGEAHGEAMNPTSPSGMRPGVFERRSASPSGLDGPKGRDTGPESNPFQSPNNRGLQADATPNTMKEDPTRPESNQPWSSAKGPDPTANPFFSGPVQESSPFSPPASSDVSKNPGESGIGSSGESVVELNFSGFGGKLSGLSQREEADALWKEPSRHSESHPGSESESNGGSRFPENPFDSEHGFATLFSQHAKTDASLPSPETGAEEDLGEEEPGVWGAMFTGSGADSPVPAASTENAGNQWAGFAPAPPAERAEAPPSPTENSTTSDGGTDRPGEREADSFSLPTGFSGFAPAPQAPEIPGPQAPDMPKGDARRRGESSDPGGGESAVFEEFAAAETGVGELGPAPREKAPISPPAPAIDIRDLELRAIFSSSETFTLSKVARNVVDLPGIVSCALSTPQKFVQASRSEKNRIGPEAREMVATLRNLAAITGLPDARTFTLHTDRGIVSFFLEGNCCLTVNHESTEFHSGVREKLILVARNLSTVEG